MKHLRYLLPIILLLLLSVCHAEFHAYLEGDTVLVTDEAQDAEPITELTLGKGETLFVDVRGGDTVEFYTSDAYIVRADSIGALIGADKGSTRVKIFYAEDEYIQLKCTVKKAPTSMEFEQDTITLTVDSTTDINCAVNAGAAGNITLYSLDESVAVVNADGSVSAMGIGETDIVAETYNDVTATCHVTVTYPAPATITGSDSISGYEGESAALDCATDGGYHETLSYESLTPDVVTVDENGSVAFRTTGTGTLRVLASGGAVKDVNVIVYPGTTLITPEQSVYTLYTGGEAELKAACEGGSGAYSAISGDNGVVKAEGTRITAVGEGSTEVILVTPNGVSCHVTVNVLRFPLDVSLSVDDTCLAIGETAQAEYMDDTQVHLPMIFASSDPGVCSVDGEGLITALSEGMAEITLTCGGVTQFVDIEVTQPASAIYFEPDALTLAAGDVTALEVVYADGGGRVSFSSSDENVARCADGYLTAVATGEAVVTAALSNGQTAKLAVTVEPALRTLRFETDVLTLCVGDVYAPALDAGGDTWSQLTWASARSSVADVTDGVITGNTAGETTITVSGGGLTAQLQVTVKPAHDLLSINADPVNGSGSFTHYLGLAAGETYQLTVDCCRTYTFASLDPGIAEVSETGLITAHKKGTAKLTVTAACGAQAVLMVEVQ